MTHPCQFFPVGDPSGGGGGLDWSEPAKTADFPSENGKGYPIDTTSGPVTMSLPGAPTAGDQVGWKDYENNFQNAEFYADPQGKLIEGVQGPLKVTSRGAGGTLVFIDDEVGWLLVDHTPLDGGTVANKPFFRAQDRKSQGSSSQTFTVGYHRRVLTTVINNEIPGAGLSNNLVTLPAGEYYIEAYSPFGWVNPNAGQCGGRLFIRDSAGTTLLKGTGVSNYMTSHGFNTCDVVGKLVLTEPTDIEVAHYHIGPSDESSGGSASNISGQDEIFTDLRIWKLDTEIKTITVQDPQQYLKKPLMHLQNQQASGVGGGTSINGANPRPFNTALADEIAGASYSGAEITLPAGEYFVEGVFSSYDASGQNVRAEVRDGNDTVLIKALTQSYAGGLNKASSPISGRITLASEGIVKFVTIQLDQADTGLGFPQNVGGDNVYADAKIWALSQVVQQPIVYNQPVQPITGAYTTGNIFGGELEYVDATHVNVKPVSCMSDDLTTQLYIDAVTNIAISPAADTVYNFFIVRYDSATFGIEFDTDVNGANLPANVTHKRWLGYVITDSSGNINAFTQQDDTVSFHDPTKQLLASGVSSNWTQLHPENFMPTSRVKAWLPSSTLVWHALISLDGGSTLFAFIIGDGAGSTGRPHPMTEVPGGDTTVHVRRDTASADQSWWITRVKLKR